MKSLEALLRGNVQLGEFDYPGWLADPELRITCLCFWFTLGPRGKGLGIGCRTLPMEVSGAA